MRLPAYLCGVIACCGIAVAAPAPDACHLLRHHGKLDEARACYTGLARSGDAYLRAEGYWGLGEFQKANEQFRVAVADAPDNPEYKVRWGRLFLERFNKVDAGKLFGEALDKDAKDAGAYLGLALVASEDFSEKAVSNAQRALEFDPKLVEAQELLAYLALEDNDTDKATAAADKAIAISSEALDAMAIRATIDWMDDKSATPWTDRIFKINPVYGEAYAIAGHFFVINRRYDEGIAFYRKALQLDPQLWEARAQLGVNLMRLGDDKEARQQLEQCYNGGYRNDETVNSLRLLDSYKNFETFKTPTTVLRLQKKEADLLRPYFQAELDRAIATYQVKYHLKLKGPVQLEVYPDHEDFAVRTMGLPGLGALGVTFNTVVAMDSPSGRPPGSFHWASTMWHELSHVYVLSATNSRVPRWFVEGLAVYEETAVAPDWGDRLDPDAIHAMQQKKLLPIAELDRGFVRPSYPSQVVVSYFQAGQICTFIASKWGYEKLLEMMHAYGSLETTPQVLKDKLALTPEEFDKQFMAWLDARTSTQVGHYAEWKSTVQKASEELKAKNYDAAIHDASAVRDFYPDFVEPGSAYELLADAYLAKGDKRAAAAQLESYSSIGGRNPGTIERLATLQQEAGDKQKAIATLERLNFVYPEDEQLHRRLGDLCLAQGKNVEAIREYRAVLALKPLDQASSHYELAKALRAANDNKAAQDEVLLALEAAPGYKPAQQLLLELSK